MKTLLLIVASLTSSCATREYVHLTEQVAENGIQRYEDKKNNVTCYVYRDDDGNSMSCLRKHER